MKPEDVAIEVLDRHDLRAQRTADSWKLRWQLLLTLWQVPLQVIFAEFVAA